MSCPSVVTSSFGKLFPFALAVVAFAPLALGCDALKKDSAPDAAAIVVAPVAPATAAAPTDTTPGAAAPATGTVAPLGAVAPTPGGGAVRPVIGDAGKAIAADGGAAADGGKTAPAPTPTFAIPTAIPGFDAGAFKPPAGFPTAIPTTLPTFPPPPK